MNKENLFKKFLTKSFIGFPIGVTLLLISYISVYFITDQALFSSELYQLHNIKTLILQTISAGISGYLLIFVYLQSLEIENIFASHTPSKSTLIMLISLLCMSTIIIILGNPRIFSENIRTLNCTTMILFYSIACVISFIKKGLEKYWIKQINKKLQKR